jgi:hypothetical protein
MQRLSSREVISKSLEVLIKHVEKIKDRTSHLYCSNSNFYDDFGVEENIMELFQQYNLFEALDSCFFEMLKFGSKYGVSVKFNFKGIDKHLFSKIITIERTYVIYSMEKNDKGYFYNNWEGYSGLIKFFSNMMNLYFSEIDSYLNNDLQISRGEFLFGGFDQHPTLINFRKFVKERQMEEQAEIDRKIKFLEQKEFFCVDCGIILNTSASYMDRRKCKKCRENDLPLYMRDVIFYNPRQDKIIRWTISRIETRNNKLTCEQKVRRYKREQRMILKFLGEKNG